LFFFFVTGIAIITPPTYHSAAYHNAAQSKVRPTQRKREKEKEKEINEHSGVFSVQMVESLR